MGKRGVFLLRFLLFWGFGVAIVAWLPVIERASVSATIGSMAGGSRLLGIPAVVQAPVIQVGRAALAIIPDCTPIGPALALWAAILAYPAGWDRRLLGIAASVPALWVLNLLRVASLLAIMNAKPAIFETVHSLLWQPATLLAVLSAFAVWVRVVARRAA